MANDDDPFDSLFTLEDRYYRDGFNQGAADGVRAGRIEGRVFGYEKAFEKYIRVGRLHGRAVVLQERLNSSAQASRASSLTTATATSGRDTASGASVAVEAPDAYSVPTGESATATPPSLAVAEQQQEEQEEQQRRNVSSNGWSRHILPPLPHPERVAKHIDILHALTEPPTFSTQNDEDAVADVDDRLRRAEAKTKLIDRMLGGAGDAEPVRANRGQGQAGLNRDGGKASGDMEEFAMRANKVRTAS